MSTPIGQNRISAGLFGNTRSAILALLFCHGDESYYLRQIVRLTGAGHGAIQRELGHLLKLGLIVRNKRGMEVYYQANMSSPAFAEIRGLMIKTAGMADVLRTALSNLSERIAVAFIYGSIASGTEKVESDVDVMIIGDVSLGDIVSVLRPVQDQLGREINPAIYTPDEMRRRIASHDHFVTSLLAEKKVFLVGDEQDFAKLA